MKIQNKLFYILVGAALTLGGTFFFFAKWDWSLKVTDLLQIIIALLIGYKIQHYTTFKYNQSRISKDQIERRVLGVEQTITKMNDLLENRYFNNSDVVSQIYESKRDFSNSVHLLSKSLSILNIHCLAITELVKLRGEYVDALTGLNFPVEPYSIETYSKAKKLQLQILECLLKISAEVITYDDDK